MNQNTAQIEIIAAAHKRQSDAAVDGECGERSPDHPAFNDVDGSAEAFERFVAEPQREKDQDERVGERGKRAGAVVAVGFFGVGGAFGPAHGEPGNAKGGNVGKIVDGVVEESDGMPEKAADNFGDDQAESGDHGPTKHGGL